MKIFAMLLLSQALFGVLALYKEPVACKTEADCPQSVDKYCGYHCIMESCAMWCEGGEGPTLGNPEITGGGEEKQKLRCNPGEYVYGKKTAYPACKLCAAGKFSKKGGRNKKCRKCPKNTYAPNDGSTSCNKCPSGFNTKRQRGKRQCFDKETKMSMKKLQKMKELENHSGGEFEK